MYLGVRVQGVEGSGSRIRDLTSGAYDTRLRVEGLRFTVYCIRSRV
jgi:hypothetical protein